MKIKAIRFFSPQEDIPKTGSVGKGELFSIGYISNSGKLVFPASPLNKLGIDPEPTHFKIGTQQWK